MTTTLDTIREEFVRQVVRNFLSAHSENVAFPLDDINKIFLDVCEAHGYDASSLPEEFFDGVHRWLNERGLAMFVFHRPMVIGSETVSGVVLITRSNIERIKNWGKIVHSSNILSALFKHAPDDPQ